MSAISRHHITEAEDPLPGPRVRLRLYVPWLDLRDARLDGLIAPIVWSAAELMRSDEIERVKVCGKSTCGWLFIDRSKNRSRRWCEMSDCGNDEKARRFQERKAGGGAGSA